MANLENAQTIEIEKLIPYFNNAKKHDEEQVTKIAASIREFGFLNPILIDKDNNIIAGHGRVLAAKKIGLTEVPCVYIEGLSETQRKAYILADNRLGELTEWDMELVNLELETLKDADFDISLTGFDLNPELEEQDRELFEEKDDEFDDIEKLEKHYGVPYQGNKSRIADIIINLLPKGERLVDLFGGGVLLPIVLSYPGNGIHSFITT